MIRHISLIAFAFLLLPLHSFAQKSTKALTFECASIDAKESSQSFLPFSVDCVAINRSLNSVQLEEVSGINCRWNQRSPKKFILKPSARASIRLTCSSYASPLYDRDVIVQYKEIQPLSISTTLKVKLSGPLFAAFPVVDEKSCSTVRLDEPGGTFYEVENIIQRMGSCQTHAGIALYDAWRFSHSNSDPRASSPAVTYLEQCKKDDNLFDVGGSVERILKYVRKHPPCALNAQKTTAVAGHDNLISENLEIFGSDVKDYIAKCRKKNPSGTIKQAIAKCAANQSVRLEKKPAGEKLENIGKYVRLDCDPKDRVTAPPSYRIKNAGKGVNITEFDRKKRHTTFAPWQRQRWQEVNDCFDKKGARCQPFGVAICNAIIADDWSQGCQGHAVVLIGRRYNAKKKSCEFLIRNSNLPNGKLEGDAHGVWFDSKELYRHVMESLQLEESAETKK